MSGKFWRESAWELPELWAALGGALEAALERIWTALDGFDEFGRGLGSSGLFWTALDWSGRLGKLLMAPGACSQLAESRKSCSYQWWEAYFVKSMLCIAEACSFAKVIDFE